MARWSETTKKWVFYKAVENDNLKTPAGHFSFMEFLNPKLKWVLTFTQDGHTEYYEEWNGIAEYNSKSEADSVIKDVKYNYPNSTGWKAIRHPLR